MPLEASAQPGWWSEASDTKTAPAPGVVSRSAECPNQASAVPIDPVERHRQVDAVGVSISDLFGDNDLGRHAGRLELAADAAARRDSRECWRHLGRQPAHRCRSTDRIGQTRDPVPGATRGCQIVRRTWTLPLFGPPNIDRLMAKGDIPGLVSALGYQGFWRVRRDAAAALGQIGSAADVESLIDALEDDNASVRIAAITALGNIGDAAATGPLAATLGSQAVDIRKAAADSLGQIGDPAAVEALVICLKDVSWSVRRAAASALGRIGDARAADPLKTAFDDSDANVRRAVGDALAALGWQPNGQRSVSKANRPG